MYTEISKPNILTSPIINSSDEIIENVDFVINEYLESVYITIDKPIGTILWSDTYYPWLETNYPWLVTNSVNYQEITKPTL